MSAVDVSPREEFVGLASAAFGFLADRGFTLVEAAEDLLRYASEHRFVNVYFARDSYNVGVEVGRWIDVEGQVVEQLFPIVYLVAVRSGATELDRIRSATDRGQLERELERLAEVLRANLDPLLAGDDVFEQMNELSISLSQRYTEGIRASRLRARAEEAWSRKDLATVALSYAEIAKELPTVSLRPSELARLRYAEEHLNT